MDTSFLYLFDVIILLYSAFLLMWWVRVKFVLVVLLYMDTGKKARKFW